MSLVDQDNIILTILSFCKLSNNLRINKRFSSLIDMLFYEEYCKKFINHCERSEFNSVKIMIDKVDSHVISQGFMKSMNYHTNGSHTFNIRKLLISNEKFDYDNYELLFECCRKTLYSTLELLLNHDYEDSVISQCYNIISSLTNMDKHYFIESCYHPLLKRHSRLLTLDNAKILFKINKSILKVYDDINPEIIKYFNDNQ
jgi:hypothetical protein